MQDQLIHPASSHTGDPVGSLVPVNYLSASAYAHIITLHAFPTHPGDSAVAEVGLQFSHISSFFGRVPGNPWKSANVNP